MNCILIDDVNLNNDLVEQLIIDFCPNLTVLGKFTNINDALKVIFQEPQVLIFLDIELANGTNGFDIFEFLKDRKDKVIILSAFDNFALKAFENGVVDYLVKPILIPDLLRAVNRATNQNSPIEANTNALSQSLGIIGLKKYNSFEFVNIESIILIISHTTSCEVILNDKKTLDVQMRIGEIEELLPTSSFYRAHKSHIINLSAVNSVYWKGEEMIVKIIDYDILVSRRKRPELRKILLSI